MTTLLLFFVACGTRPAAAPEPAPEAPTAKAATEAPATLAAGVIEAPSDAPEAQAIYVSLRAPGVPGPPLAAKRVAPGPFPMDFVITEADRPMGQTPIPEKIELKVTLDVDGNPMSKSDTDLEHVMTVTKGVTDVKVMLAPR